MINDVIENTEGESKNKIINKLDVKETGLGIYHYSSNKNRFNFFC